MEPNPTDAAPLPACWQCGREAQEALFCTHCGAVRELPANTDLFTVMGLPRRLGVDAADLERRFYELSRRVHPDGFGAAPPRARAASLSATALLNRAYKTLRDPVLRGRYWLELHGETLADEQRSVPPELAAVVFDVQERLSALRRAAGARRDALLAALRDDLRQLSERRDSCLGRLEKSFRQTARLGELKLLLSEISYLTTLVRNVQGAFSS